MRDCSSTSGRALRDRRGVPTTACRSLLLTAILIVGVVVSAFPRAALAQDLKARLVVQIDRLEREIRNRRWNLNTLGEKKHLSHELDLMKHLYDRVIQQESDISGLECAGATLDLDNGPPLSTESSDLIGGLLRESRGASASDAPRVGEGGVTVQNGSTTFRFAFGRQITDTEVRLIAEIVQIEDRLANDDWHLNNLEEKKQLEDHRSDLLSALRRVRNSRC